MNILVILLFVLNSIFLSYPLKDERKYNEHKEVLIFAVVYNSLLLLMFAMITIGHVASHFRNVVLF
jgi:hypothetical protein